MLAYITCTYIFVHLKYRDYVFYIYSINKRQTHIVVVLRRKHVITTGQEMSSNKISG